jgi:hypothetical protein
MKYIIPRSPKKSTKYNNGVKDPKNINLPTSINTSRHKSWMMKFGLQNKIMYLEVRMLS